LQRRDIARGERERLLAYLDVAAVELREKIGYVARDEIDDMILQRRCRRQTGRPAYGLLGPVRVTPTQLGKPTDVGDRIVDDLPSQHQHRHVP